MPEHYNYGGQAVIEGVMIRGRTHVTVAVRRPNGEIRARCEPLSGAYTGPLRQIPFVRGILVLAESMTLGLKALMFSANAALEDEDAGEEEPLTPLATAGLLTLSMGFAIGLFFLLPLFASKALDGAIDNSILSNLVEGGLRLGIFLIYIFAMGFMPEMRKVFAYHGAEHMTIAARERGEELTTQNIRKHAKEHPRCGTAFLMIVILVSIVLFTFLGRPDLWLLVLSRIVLIPVIGAVSYELIRFNAAHGDSVFAKAVIAPGLALQRLTTRKPDDGQIEVAVMAMNAALVADGEPVEESVTEAVRVAERPLTPKQPVGVAASAAESSERAID